MAEDEEWAKLRMIGEVAREVWGTERMPNIVAGKVAIVTGAGRGIGRGIALLMAQEGASVVVCDIGASLDGAGTDAGPAQAVVDEIKKAGGKAIASTLSISEPGNADKIVAGGARRLRPRRHPGQQCRHPARPHLSSHELVGLVRRHHRASARQLRHEPRLRHGHFREQNSGSFVHMTSTSGLVGNFGQANYMAAKMGIVGLSRGIALDMARFNVRSNCVAPFAWTRMIDSIPAETEEEKARVAAFREMTPEKIAPLVVYLGSDKASGISGQIFSVRNNEIYLFNQTRPIRTLQRSDGWTPDKLDKQLKGAFAASFTPLDRSSDVFSWDPV